MVGITITEAMGAIDDAMHKPHAGAGVAPAAGAGAAAGGAGGKEIDRGVLMAMIKKMITSMIELQKKGIINTQAGVDASNKVQSALSKLMNDLTDLYNVASNGSQAEATQQALTVFHDLRDLLKLKDEKWAPGLDPAVGKAISKQVNAYIDQITSTLKGLPGLAGDAIRVFLKNPSQDPDGYTISEIVHTMQVMFQNAFNPDSPNFAEASKMWQAFQDANHSLFQVLGNVTGASQQSVAMTQEEMSNIQAITTMAAQATSKQDKAITKITAHTSQ